MKIFSHRLFHQATQLLRTDAGKALVIAVLWQLLFTLMGAFFDTTLHNIFQKEITAGPPPSFFSHAISWDGGWYMSIINGAYGHPASAAPAFYPLFPFTLYLLHFITFGLVGYAVLSIILNTAALAVAVYSLKKIAGFFLPDKFTWWPPLLLITSPAAIFMHLFYAEALFCALAFAAYMFALQRKWLFMGVALGFLTATRLPAILVVGLCALEFMRAYEWNIRKICNTSLLSFLLAPLGFVAYGCYLLIARHDFFGMFTAYSLTKDWQYQAFNLNIFTTYQTIWDRLVTVFTTNIPFDEGQSINFFVPFVGILMLLMASLYLSVVLRKKGGIPLGLFGIASIIFFSLNGNLVSVQRYLLPCLGIYLAIALFASRSPIRKYLVYFVCYGGILLQAYLLILFVNGYFAG
jgi:hypothetical protein